MLAQWMCGRLGRVSPAGRCDVGRRRQGMRAQTGNGGRRRGMEGAGREWQGMGPPLRVRPRPGRIVSKLRMGRTPDRANCLYWGDSQKTSGWAWKRMPASEARFGWVNSPWGGYQLAKSAGLKPMFFVVYLHWVRYLNYSFVQRSVVGFDLPATSWSCNSHLTKQFVY